MVTGRPLEFDPDAALEIAIQVFWSKGYRSTSLHDLLKAMNLSKSSFYQTFSSKHQLFQQCITRYRDKVAGEMFRCLKETKSARQFIEEILYGIAGEAFSKDKRRGCLVMNSANEFAQSDPVISDLVAKGIERFESVFFAAVKRAQQEGDIPAHKNARILSRYLVSSMSGLKTIAKAGASQTVIKEIVRVVITAIE